MNFLVQTIVPYILLYKYWALFAVTLIASLAIPIPAGTLLVTAAAFASQHYFNIVTVVLVVILGNIAGDSICYLVSRLYGKRFLNHIGLRKTLDSKNFRRIEARIAKSPGFIICISRFEAIATLSVNIVCGLSAVPYGKFLLFESIGAVADAILYGALGYFFGDSWQAVNKLVGNFTLVLFIGIALCVVVFWKRIMAAPVNTT